MHELNTNESIKPLTVQFVPLKVITKGVTWGTWANKYPAKGNGIPKLFVIRADGEMLYGQSGSKSGRELAEFMAEHLRQAGRLFNARETAFLEGTVTAVKEHLDQGEETEAVRQIAKLSKLGTVGDLKSYSQIAIEANNLAKQLIDQGVEKIDEAVGRLDAPETQLEAAIALAEAKTVYAGIAEVNSQAMAAIREANQDREKKQALAQADAINRALARRRLRGGDKLAVKDLNRIIQRYPDTPAARLAAEHIAEISGESVADAPAAAAGDFRTWTDVTGKYKIDARLVASKKGWVQLQTRAGKKVSLPIPKLSPADQEFLAQ